jgi:hypothetical protein
MLVATLISPIKIGSPRADKNKPTRPARTCRARSPKLALVSLAALQPVELTIANFSMCWRSFEDWRKSWYGNGLVPNSEGVDNAGDNN